MQCNDISKVNFSLFPWINSGALRFSPRFVLWNFRGSKDVWSEIVLVPTVFWAVLFIYIADVAGKSTSFKFNLFIGFM